METEDLLCFGGKIRGRGALVLKRGSGRKRGGSEALERSLICGREKRMNRDQAWGSNRGLRKIRMFFTEHRN